MPAYLIADLEVFDAETYEEYKQKVPATQREFGGRYIGRGGATKVLEGDWQPNRLVIIEFPDMESLLGWYNSPQYAPLKAIRERSARSRLIALEGLV
jgi:uncharacterized protein (DUF1330 family)